MGHSYGRNHLFAAVGLLALTWAGQAAAQTADPTVRAAASLEEVVVTAQRREERLQDVPLAVTAISGQGLERAGVARIDDLAKLAPGFSIQPATRGNALLVVSMRGQRQNTPNKPYDPSTAVYFAEVVQMRPQGLNAALYDLQSVQILKGPQGTLFGRNTPAGALLITPVAPQSDLGGYAKVTYGNYNLRQFEGAVNVPLGDDWRLRISARRSLRDGYTNAPTINDHLDNENIAAWRVSLSYVPNDVFSNALVVDGMDQNENPTAFKLSFVQPGSAVATRGGQAELDQLATVPFHTTFADEARDGVGIHGITVSDITEFKLSDTLTLKNILGFRHIKSRINSNFDGSRIATLSVFETLDANQISDELQLQGTAFDDSLTYIFGGYAFQERGNNFQDAPVFGVGATNSLDITNRSKSVFGQATYDLPFLPKVSLTVGARHTWDDREMTASNFRLGVCRLLTADTGGVPLNPCTRTGTANFKAFTYNVTLDWKPTDDTLVYVARRRGYRSGGITSGANLPGEFNPFRPEFVSDTEIGLKQDWSLGGIAARTNIAAYWDDYKDIQRQQTFQLLINGLLATRSATVNAAAATIKGIDIEQTLRPFDALEISLSYSYLDASYKNFLIGTLDYSDSPLAGAPRDTFSGSARVRLFQSDSAGRFYVAVLGSYRSKTMMTDIGSYDVANNRVFPSAIIKGYGTVDARVDWENLMGKPATL
ncbi:MAG: hypothetical protein JWO33_2619, partial [Caulobacteraceae bacterium]|nr:hypothetical protein [Caulobacteraceae bacterium]